jgi:hypothetical protein
MFHKEDLDVDDDVDDETLVIQQSSIGGRLKGPTPSLSMLSPVEMVGVLNNCFCYTRQWDSSSIIIAG